MLYILFTINVKIIPEKFRLAGKAIKRTTNHDEYKDLDYIFLFSGVTSVAAQGGRHFY